MPHSLLRWPRVDDGQLISFCTSHSWTVVSFASALVPRITSSCCLIRWFFPYITLTGSRALYSARIAPGLSIRIGHGDFTRRYIIRSSLLAHFVHLFLNLLLSIHGCRESQIHVIWVVLPDIDVLHGLPVYSVADGLSGGPKGRERIQPLIGSKNLPDVSRCANVPLALERAALLF